MLCVQHDVFNVVGYFFYACAGFSFVYNFSVTAVFCLCDFGAVMMSIYGYVRIK
jgi:hypothetical protein